MCCESKTPRMGCVPWYSPAQPRLANWILDISDCVDTLGRNNLLAEKSDGTVHLLGRRTALHGSHVFCCFGSSFFIQGTLDDANGIGR